MAVAALISSSAFAGANLLKDPGFEKYHLDKEKGYYVPDKDADWKEIPAGSCSVRFDASKWSAPAEMTKERKIGFSPGAAGFEGPNVGQNRGRMALIQDVVFPKAPAAGSKYEAWIWLGGGGKDDQLEGQDRKDESGGWMVQFFPSENPADWDDKTVLQTHDVDLDFYGKPESFVRVSGYGAIPDGARGVRMKVHAGTWFTASGPGDYDTVVAMDNAHFAILDKPNLLVNGDFEQDKQPTEFKGWRRPAEYAFETKNLQPIDVNDVYNNRGYKNWDQNFDHNKFLPFFGGKWSYGYVTYMCGWADDAFSFSQKVDYSKTAQLTLMCNWIQDTQKPGDAWQLRERGSALEFVIQYLKDGKEISKEDLKAAWPSPAVAANRCKTDQNGHKAYNPRFRITPPAGTEQICVNVNVLVRSAYGDGMSHLAMAVDDFWLAEAE